MVQWTISSDERRELGRAAARQNTHLKTVLSSQASRTPAFAS